MEYCDISVVNITDGAQLTVDGATGLVTVH
jgi:hypothetical protein